MTGVGKTFRNVREIEQYLQFNPESGKQGRKVLVFDSNDDDYAMYATVDPDQVHRLVHLRARRIRPLTKEGRNMTTQEKREVVEKMIHHFRDGLIVLDDIDKYLVAAKGQSIISLLTTNRHNGLDILISHQSIAKITTTEWQNCTWLRLHKQVDDISRYSNRIPNYFLVRIATFIIDQQFDRVNQAYNQGLINEYELKKYRSFCLYVDMRRLKIRGCTVQAFIHASKRFIDTEKGREVGFMLKEMNHKNKPLYKDRNAAVLKLLTNSLQHFENSGQPPILNPPDS